MSVAPPSAAAERFATFDCAGDTCIGVIASSPTAAAAGVGVVIVVGGPQYRAGSHRQFVDLSRALAKSGTPAFRFDYRGMGDSEGERRTFEEIDDDIAAAITALQQATAVRRIVLWGLCDGASAALMYAAGDERVAGVVALNPWARSERIQAATRLRHYYVRRAFTWQFWRKAMTGGYGFGRGAGEFAGAIRGAMTQESAGGQAGYLQRMHEGWTAFRGPVLCMLSGRDYTAREFEAWIGEDRQRQRLLQRPQSELWRVDAADHTLSDAGSRDAATAKTIEWIARLTPAY